jgi:hypothetical protein
MTQAQYPMRHYIVPCGEAKHLGRWDRFSCGLNCGKRTIVVSFSRRSAEFIVVRHLLRLRVTAHATRIRLPCAASVSHIQYHLTWSAILDAVIFASQICSPKRHLTILRGKATTRMPSKKAGSTSEGKLYNFLRARPAPPGCTKRFARSDLHPWHLPLWLRASPSSPAK